MGDISDIVDLPPGATVTSTATGTLDASATGLLVNTATVTPPPGDTDPDLTNNSFTDMDETVMPIFCDGFESGDTSMWSSTGP